VGEEIVGTGQVEKLFGEAALSGRGLEIIFVFGEILGHSDELSSHVAAATNLRMVLSTL